MLKEKFKENRLIVCIYEMIMNPIHRLELKFLKFVKKFPKKFAKTRFTYGKRNTDKVFYIIKCNASDCGLFSLILVNVLPFLKVSKEKKYIPIIDYKSTEYLQLIQDKQNYGKDNPWEYYFEQPGGNYFLSEVYESANVEMCNQNKHGFKEVHWNSMMPMPKKQLEYWSQIANEYIRPTKEVLQRIYDEKNKMFLSQRKIMGVSIRAGYRRAALLNLEIIKNHPKVNNCEYYIQKIEEKMKEWGYGMFFLACEDREYVTKMDNYFGDRCCHMDRRYRHMFINDIPVADIEELNREYEGSTIRETTIEYIIETYLLASCDSLYSTIGGGAQFAYIVNGGKYKNVEIYNEGMY